MPVGFVGGALQGRIAGLLCVALAGYYAASRDRRQ
jgi:hypothetical protein